MSPPDPTCPKAQGLSRGWDRHSSPGPSPGPREGAVRVVFRACAFCPSPRLSSLTANPLFEPVLTFLPVSRCACTDCGWDLRGHGPFLQLTLLSGRLRNFSQDGGGISVAFCSVRLFTYFSWQSHPRLPSVLIPWPLPVWFFNCLNYVAKRVGGALLVPQTFSLKHVLKKHSSRIPHLASVTSTFRRQRARAVAQAGQLPESALLCSSHVRTRGPEPPTPGMARCISAAP